MKQSFMILLFACSLCGYGQNVVTNGSFEIKEPNTGCPNQTGFSNGRPQGWFAPTTNGFTPDYYFPCAAPGSAWYPGSNIIGCEYPLQGQAYAGFLAQQVFSDGFVPTFGSEYISQQVSLTANQQYNVEFYVSLADGTNTNPNNTAVKKLGMFFLTPGGSLAPGAVKGLHHLIPQIPNTFPAANFYTSAGGWTKISGNFTPSASGAWTIVIGNFDSNLNQTTVLNNPNTQPSASSPDGRFSYYFVDGVTILPVGQTPPDYSIGLSPISVCSSGTNFTVLNQPFGTTPSWSSSNPSGLSINSSTGVATRQNNFNGQVTITATLGGACGNTNFPRLVNVGNYTPIGISSVNSNCSGNSFNVLNTSLSGICSANKAIYFAYNITDPNYSNFVYTPVSVPSGASWSGGGRNLNVTVYTPSSSGSRTATIALSATGPCGVYNVNFNSAAVNISSGWRFSMSPNPSDGEVTVNTDSESLLDKDSQTLIYAIKVNDPSGLGSETFEYQSGINSVSISLKDRQPGMYILSVFNGKTWSSKQLLIQK